MMPKNLPILACALLLAPLRTLAAQESDATAHETITIGSVDFGGRLFDISGDAARDQRYRDLRSGPTVDRARYARDDGAWRFDAGADHAGYRDQRYFADYRNGGKVKASFEWNEIPLFNSTIPSTPYTQPSPGVFRLDPTVQQGIQAGTLSLSSLELLANRFDLP